MSTGGMDVRSVVGIIFRSAWLRVLDDPVLSHYFPTAPFPVWINHQNLKSVLSYKHKIFDDDHTNREYKDFEFQKFNRPKPRKRMHVRSRVLQVGVVIEQFIS